VIPRCSGTTGSLVCMLSGYQGWPGMRVYGCPVAPDGADHWIMWLHWLAVTGQMCGCQPGLVGSPGSCVAGFLSLRGLSRCAVVRGPWICSAEGLLRLYGPPDLSMYREGRVAWKCHATGLPGAAGIAYICGYIFPRLPGSDTLLWISGHHHQVSSAVLWLRDCWVGRKVCGLWVSGQWCCMCGR
jgi:hypothetical protein